MWLVRIKNSPEPETFDLRAGPLETSYRRIGMTHEPRKVAIRHKVRRQWRQRERAPKGKTLAYLMTKTGAFLR